MKKLAIRERDRLIAERGLDPAYVEEATVPDFGLRDGVVEVDAGGATATLTLGHADRPTLTWRAADGRASRAIPRDAKAADPGGAARAKQIVDDVEGMRAAQRTRIDLIMRRANAWPVDAWRVRYLDHGLVGTIARRLIWTIDEIPAIWRDGVLVDVDGCHVVADARATVRLWHPALRPVDEVVAWRAALQRWEITQPFKQAHREVYLLTDAERRTATYSNRFAAHLVRGPTLLAITQARQWKAGLFGGASSPSFDLPAVGMRAEWWVSQAGDESTPYGAPLFLATDQVRFVTRDERGDPLPLDAIPPLVLSEVLRDVDLFVGVASVGNDPTWQDGGPGGRYRDYWQAYSFGELNETAKTRRAVLEALLPRLTKLRGRWSLADKFLVVRGSIRTYKIHLGSGNIIMESNDQYLCIVPDRSSAARGEQGGGMFLPFEGDATLSVILSKAFLLADDARISDPTITRQIGSRQSAALDRTAAGRVKSRQDHADGTRDGLPVRQSPARADEADDRVGRVRDVGGAGGRRGDVER